MLAAWTVEMSLFPSPSPPPPTSLHKLGDNWGVVDRAFRAESHSHPLWDMSLLISRPSCAATRSEPSRRRGRGDVFVLPDFALPVTIDTMRDTNPSVGEIPESHFHPLWEFVSSPSFTLSASRISQFAHSLSPPSTTAVDPMQGGVCADLDISLLRSVELVRLL